MDVLMPDGTTITGVPEGITQSELLARYNKFSAMKAAPAAAPSGLASIAPKPATPNAMTGNEYLEQLAKREEKQPDRTVSGSVIDAGVTALKAAIGLPEAFLGLADIPSGGTIGKFLEDAGYKPKEAKEILDTYLSEAQQYANRQVKETKGFLPTIGAALQNPSTIATAVGESLPQMLGGAGIARGILKAAPGLAPYLAGAAGEGLLGAGSAAEQIRQSTEDKLLTGKQALSAVGSGVGTAAFGVAGGKLAKKLGLDDVDTLLAGGAAQGTKSVKDFAKKATYSGISEGVFEEMPQSAQETMWMNYALDKPLLDGVPEAAAMGLVTGATMGVGATGLGSLSRRKTAEVPPVKEPTAEVPPAPQAAPIEPTTPPAAPPSAVQDTGAMLREALGEDINTVNMPAEKAPEAPVEAALPAAEVQPAPVAIPPKAPTEQPPSTELIEQVLPEAPKAEPTLKEQYDKAAKLNFAAGDAFRNKLINQQQLDKIRSDYDRIKTEYQASIPRAELNPVQQEAIDIADKLEALGLKPFADGMRTSVEKNQVKEQNLEFYRTKLKQEQAKQSTLEEGVERPSERWDWSKFYGDDTKGLEKLKLFNSKAPPAVKQTLQALTDSIQAVTDRLNDEGYAMRGAAELNVPDEIKNLRSQIMLRSAEGSLLINKFEALNKGFKRSKNTTNQQNLDTAIQEAKAGITEAQKSLQRSIPEPEEVVNARAAVAEANKRVESLEYKSGSLWSALMGKLDPEEVREIFGPNPSLGEKKLQVTKKSGKRGTYISEMADNGVLDPFLPIGMRRASGRFDAAVASQYIKDAVANKDYLPDDAKEEIKQIYRDVEPLGDLIDEYLTIEEQNRELQIAFDEQREIDQAAEIIEPEGEDRAAKPSERPAGEFELTAPTKDELKAKQDEIDRLNKENERLSKEAERKAKADEQAAEFTLTGSDREADVAAARGQKDIFAEAPAKEAPKDNKQEIEDLRAEQKVLIRQIIKAGLQETPEQEARMAEISKRLDDLEGRAPVKQAEKPVVKKRSVEEIREELQDLEDELDIEFNKDKRKSLVSSISKLQGELTAAEGRAARAAAEEKPAEEPEVPEGTVATPDGAVLRYPLAVSMVGEGYKVLALDDARTYKDKGGEPHRTFEKGPLRIAMTPQRVLFQNRNAVNIGFGNPDQVTLEAIMVDPGSRNQGLATQAMNDVIEAADKNEITLYLEPVPIVNVKKNDFGLDRDQLVDFYSKFGFEFQEDSNKVMQRKPSAEVAEEVLPAVEEEVAGQVGFEPYTIEGDFTEVAEEQQRLMLEDQTENLSDAQISTLEKHYGTTIDTDEFFTKLREDVTNFIVKGATAVNGKIRAIIRQLANGVLAVGIAFNPQYMSQPLNVFMPTDNVRTEEVLAKVPDAATDKMSEPAKRAFAVIYPAIQEQMVAKDKLFIMADKPSGRVFVFNPDGSLLLEKKSLFGLAKGDLYVGDNDKPQNRITPAGLFDLKLVDAQKGESEKRTAGDYDTGTVLAINDPDGTITIMHSVWLKEKDAAQRAAALRNESPADSRYSFGCINVDAPTYKYMVDNHAKQMDGAALFIVPEAGVDVMSFITGKGAMSEDLARIKVKPVTKEIRTPQRQATQAEAKTKTPGREERFFSLEKQTGAPYVTQDEIFQMQRDAYDELRQTDKFKKSQQRIEAAQKESNDRYNAVVKESIRLLKENPQFKGVLGDLSDSQVERIALSYREAAEKNVPKPKNSEHDALVAQNKLIEDFFKQKNIPEPRQFSEQANQDRPYYSDPRFKKWFKDSKAVNKDGRPLVAFHTTDKDFNIFSVGANVSDRAINPNYSGKLGSWFTAPSLYENEYEAGNAEGAVSFSEGKEGDNTMLVHLSIQNPKEYEGFEDLQEDRDSYPSVAKFKQALIDEGHDGVVIRNSLTDGNVDRDDWVAFYDTQIKSAIGNTGEFDESANINMNLGDSLVKLVDQMADDMAEDEKKRSPSYKRQTKALTRQRNEGRLTDEEYQDRMTAAMDEDDERRLSAEPKPRKRGYLHIQNRLNEAVQAKDLSREAYDLANWFMLQNEDLVADLGISIKGKGPAGAGGFYNNLSRIITLIKEGSSDLTATHEILHHLERMMPAKIQQAIRKAWLSQLTKAQKAAKVPAEKLYFDALIDAHFGDNKANLLNVPKEAGNEYAAARSNMEDSGKTTSMELAKQLLLLDFVPIEAYQYFNPSEFWAVNGSRIVLNRYNAVDRGLVNKLKNWLRELGQKMKSIFGLKSDASIIRALDSLAKSDGKFVTDEMLGTGEYLNIKKNAFGGEMPKATWAMKESNNFDDWVQTWQDNYRDLKNVQKIITDKIGKIDDRLNAYRKETLNPGREAEQAQEFLKYEVDPLVKEMRKNNVSNEELATYLHNRYAEERNEIINAKNKSPAVQDQGSGISTENARKYLKALPADRAKVLESLAARIDGIVRGSQDILVESGQETQETISGWRKESPHYVPLKRDESELDFIVQSGSGNLGGFATAGKFGKEALGSTKTVKNILENIMLQRDRAIRRAESIRIGQALYGLAIQYPNPDFYMAINPDAIKDVNALVAEMEEMGLEPELISNILEQPKTGFVKKTTGPEGETVREVKYRIDRAYQNAKNVFPIRINGQNRFVLFNPKSPEAMRLAAELKQLNSEKLGVFFGAASTLSRWFAAVNTQYNPAFGLVNILNDTQGALVNLSTTPLAGKQADVAKSVLPALKGIARDIRKERKQTEKSVIKTEYDPKDIKPEDWTSLWRLFRQAGGKTGFRDQMVRQRMDVEWKGFIPHFKFEDEHAMMKAMEKLEQGPIKKKVEWFADAFSDFNDTLENTVRLAVFKVAYVDNNLSVEEAAEIAKNITVNFNKRGAKTKVTRGLYAFFNASLQGTARYATTLAGPAGGLIVKTGLTMGAVNAMWMFMAGFDDDDPPQFTKNKGFIVPTGSGDYFIWNLPPGLRAIPNTGRLLTEGMLISVGAMKSNRGLGGKIADAGSVMIDAINPFGGGTFLQTIAPTFLDPAMALAENKDSFGRPIFKEDPSLKPTPGWQRTRDSASTFSKGLAWFLNYASAGGEEFNKGFISPTGDQLDFLIGQATGGIGRELKRTVDLGINKYEGEETPAYRVPLANRFLGETKTEAATAARFYDNVTMLARHENVLNGRIDNKGDVQGYYKENPIARYAFVANDFENDVSSLNRTMSDLRKLPDTKENKDKIKRVKEAKLKTMETLNNLVRKAQ
jgi:GNAT superfamily N-acetyltransferase